MCTAIRVLDGWPSVKRGRRAMRGRRPMAKWIKVDRIRSLQIRRRLAPGTCFKRSFECSVPAPRSPMLRMPCGASPRRRGRAEASRCVEKAACGAAGTEPLHMQAFRHNWRLRPVCAAGGSLRMARGAWATGVWQPGIQKNALNASPGPNDVVFEEIGSYRPLSIWPWGAALSWSAVLS